MPRCHGWQGAAILHSLAQLGYAVEWQVLNSKHFGVPQNRERVIIAGHFGNKCTGKIFPLPGEDGPALKKIIGGRQGSRVYSQHGAACTLSANGGGFAANTGLYLITVGESLKIRGEANCLDANYYKGLDNHQQRTGVLVKEGTKQGYAVAFEGDGINMGFAGNQKKRGRVAHGLAPTLTTDANIGTLCGARIRKLTPLECFRLQGFPDSHYHNAKAAGLSDSQLYKQAGNAVTVPVIHAVAKALMDNCYG